MRKLLIITQKVDQSDDLLGFFVSWIGEFSKHFSEVHVITLAAGRYTLPPNVHVHSLGKEKHAPKLLQAWRMVGLLWVLTRHCDTVFAHMSPIFAILAWPFAVLRRRKLVLWYLHRSVTLRLRLALMLCDTVVTADAESLRIRSPKIISVGHGIDIVRFATARQDAVDDARPLRVLSVGRLSPIKGYETLIRAAALLRDRDAQVDVRIIGRPVMQADHAYAHELSDTVRRLGVQDCVHFFGFVPYHDMPQHYRWADVVVGCTPSGGIDKTLLEAMASGCAVLTSNNVMRRYFPPAYGDQLIFPHGDSAVLADKLDYLSARDMPSINTDMLAAVREHHELSRTIEKIAHYL